MREKHSINKQTKHKIHRRKNTALYYIPQAWVKEKNNHGGNHKMFLNEREIKLQPMKCYGIKLKRCFK